ncbi:hypothetical protein G6F23_014601 [Rhizopus arrhizus]|nr:hypothetical protein G6F23_014601 [Rhizopus arrhizus]
MHQLHLQQRGTHFVVLDHQHPQVLQHCHRLPLLEVFTPPQYSHHGADADRKRPEWPCPYESPADLGYTHALPAGLAEWYTQLTQNQPGVTP